METIVNKNEYQRRDYYFKILEDSRNIFIGFGHWLERLGIKGNGSLEDYECYLNMLDKQKELERQDEHLKMLKWISDNESINFPFKITTGDKWDEFWNSYDEDCEMDMITVECDEFYIKFKEITGINLLELSDNFVSMSYIDEAQNDIEIIINDVNGNNKRFIIGV